MIVKLEYGSVSLNINDGVNYKLSPNFTPPAVAIDTNYAAGTSANRYGGSKLIGRRSRDRQWSFDVIVMGTSTQETHACARRLQEFIDMAGRPPETMYLTYQATDGIAYTPMFGQIGMPLKYPVKHASMTLGDMYGMGKMRQQRLFVAVTLEVAPYARGTRQRVLTGYGGLIDDWIGAPDGQSRGLIVPEATTNKMTNPVFGNGSGYATNWTAGAGISAAENTDLRYIVYGFSSAKLTAIGSSSRTFTQTIHVGNTNNHILSCYAKLPDGGVISATQCRLWYDDGKTTTYTPVGNGWYRLSVSVTGMSSNRETGIEVVQGYTVYVDAFQIEEKAYITPFCYGNLPGCAWTSTAHASTSTRTAAKATVPATILPGCESQGTIVMAIRAATAGTERTTGQLLELYSSSQSITLRWGSAKWYADFGAQNSESADTFSVNQLIIFHLTWGAGTGMLYVDGAAGSSANYAFSGAYTTLYVGSDESGATQANHTILGMAYYPQKFTAAEVTASYADLYDAVNSGSYGVCIGALPYMWTKDGDNQLDNGTDSTPQRNSYAYIGGIPGSAPAITDMAITSGGAPSTYGRLNMSLLPVNYGQLTQYVNTYFEDEAGTTLASANGSAVLKTAVNTTAAAIASDSIPRAGLYFLAGREYYLFARMYVATSTNKTYDVAPSFSVGSNTVTGDEVRKTFVSTARLYYFGPLVAPAHEVLQYEKIGIGAPTITVNLMANTTATRSTATVDYMATMPRPVLMVPTTNFTYSTGQLYISGKDVIVWDGTSYRDTAQPIGDAIEFLPGYLNQLAVLLGDESVANLVSWTATITSWVTPRYALL